VVSSSLEYNSIKDKQELELHAKEIEDLDC